jgi:hypothetical protein
MTLRDMGLFGIARVRDLNPDPMPPGRLTDRPIFDHVNTLTPRCFADA